ncbi:unnamed protein product [Parascedosporium putredinis]|uniref:(4-O-methyl)-D-glucuronate--lignin esterase n=1 Tax=Parascedosporium putredinis TaxID=1442378 RepID=A0A9P1H4X4_9PEZI|nr:unnamed protein product [Parascedosporium putredinis]CAI7996359.1 unnamed protein product [Parascedosporium putredinis]
MHTMLLLSLSLLVSVAFSQLATDCVALPKNADLLAAGPQSTLPDPFLMFNGDRVTRKSQWNCRRQELMEIFQRTVYGKVPGPPEALTTRLNGTDLVIDITHGEESISFSVNITLPRIGIPPYPAIIAFGGMTIPVPDDVAVIIYKNDEIARIASSYNSGKFYTLYGTEFDAGLMAASAWGLSRVIDALELTPEAAIDARRLATTGCSRNARAVLLAGAFDERLALTISQEAGVGGDACWRIAEWEKQQERFSICDTQCDEPPDGLGRAFGNFSRDPDSLPVDQHELAGLIAPRALLVLQAEADWLRPRASFACMVGARRVWDALNVSDHMAVSMAGGHGHCVFPERQRTLLDAYIRKFLVRSDEPSGDTDLLEGLGDSSTRPVNILEWVQWETPSLED